MLSRFLSLTGDSFLVSSVVSEVYNQLVFEKSNSFLKRIIPRESSQYSHGYTSLNIDIDMTSTIQLSRKKRVPPSFDSETLVLGLGMFVCLFVYFPWTHLRSCATSDEIFTLGMGNGCIWIDGSLGE